MSFSTIGKFLPKYNEYLQGTTPEACVNSMLQAKPKGKIVVKFFAAAVDRKEWKTSAPFRSLLDCVATKSSELSADNQKKFQKVATVFAKKAKKADLQAKAPTLADLSSAIRKTLDKLVKKNEQTRPLKDTIVSALKSVETNLAAMRKVFNSANDMKALASDPKAPGAELAAASYQSAKAGLTTLQDTGRAEIDSMKQLLRGLESAVASIPDAKAKSLCKDLNKQLGEFLDLCLQDTAFKPLT